MKFTIKILLGLLLTIQLAFANTEENTVPDIPVDLSIQSISDSGNLYLAFSYQNFSHWHTYWKNPGDAGLPVSVKVFSNGKEVKLEALEWPVPSRFIEKGNIEAFGYSNSYTRFFKVVPGQLKGELEFKSHWLVCKHICIPGEMSFKGNASGMDLNLTPTPRFTLSKDNLLKRLNALPKEAAFPPELDITLRKAKGKNTLTLTYNLSNVAKSNLFSNLNLLTPFPVDIVDFGHESLYFDKKNNLYARYPMDWDGEYEEPPRNLPSDGKFKKPLLFKFLYANPFTQKVEIIKKEIHSFSVEESSATDNFFALLTPYTTQVKMVDGEPVENESTGSKGTNNSLLFFLLFAFLGGLILNVMPCVLPVISIKLFSLLSQRDESKSRIVKHNLFYTLGVISTFMLFGAIVVGLKSAGEAVGWGFQLQSPRFVGVMILVLFIMTLNLFGLFEFFTPGGRSLGGVDVKDTIWGDFLGGVLATILSTPCSAPFLGTALTFAFSGESYLLFLTFLFIGLGLASPFILTAIFPSLIKLLPKPGMWMEHLKKFLGLSLILTTVWLLDVFSALVPTSSLVIKLNTLLALIFFAFYFAKNISSKFWKKSLIFVFPLLLFININMANFKSTPGESTALLNEKQSEGLPWEKWTPEKMQALKGELIFIDFTAKWCFTCKINEKLVLNTNSFKELVKERKVRLLLADWTKRDPVITKFLRSQNLVGVPAYFIQTKDGKLINLGETITIGKIKENL